MKKKMLVVLFVLLVLGVVSSTSVARTYVMEELDIPYWASEAHGINERGQIVGISYPPYGRSVGFLLDKEAFTEVLPNAFLFDCNNRGDLVGFYDYLQGFSIIKNNVFDFNLGTSFVCGINNSGTVVGYYDNNSEVRAFYRENEQIYILPTLGGNSSTCTSINDRGQKAGSSTTEEEKWGACFWENDLPSNISPPDSESSWAWDINNRGQVVGWSDPGNGRFEVFIWEDGNTINIGNYGYFSWPYAINDHGQVVFESGGGMYPMDAKAYVWENGEVTDLSMTTVWPCTATAINNSGIIVGMIYKTDVNWGWYSKAVKWTPIN